MSARFEMCEFTLPTYKVAVIILQTIAKNVFDSDNGPNLYR